MSMVRNLQYLYSAGVIATDGTIGRVLDFLFDDRSWTIRYLVVDVRTWMVRHDVVIPIEAIHELDWEKKNFHVRLTRVQVRESPDLDARRPVSRQQEMAVRNFYGWPKYWHDMEIDLPVRGKYDFPAAAGDDPHLRSTEAIAGYGVLEGNRELGHVESFVMDDSSWHIGYLGVRTGSWLDQHSILVPTPWVKSISWSGCRVSLHDTYKHHLASAK